MRLLLACLALFLTPSVALVLTEGYLAGIEDQFLKDAQSHVTYLERVARFYPPNVKKMRDAPAIQQLKLLIRSGSTVAANVCASQDLPYRRLFDHLPERCNQWLVFRRARRAALFSVLLTFVVLAIVLLSRIKVTRAVARQEWSGDWSHWFVLRGMPLLVLLQLAAASAGYYILLQTITGKIVYAVGILALPFAILFWLERRLILAFVEPKAMAAFRPKHSAAPRRRAAVGRFEVR
jgi:hypothetical protein